MKHTVSYLPFESWPLDLLIDYILKIHHRGIREKGPQPLNLLETVMNSHTDSRPELKELHHLFVDLCKIWKCICKRKKIFCSRI